jgi:hypothetical protein
MQGVGLLSGAYDASGKRSAGNFPQAFSHVPLIDTARTLSAEDPRNTRGSGRRRPPGSGRSGGGTGPGRVDGGFAVSCLESRKFVAT